MESGIKDMTVLVFKEGRLKKTIQYGRFVFCSGCDGGRDSFTAQKLLRTPCSTFVENGNKDIICFSCQCKSHDGKLAGDIGRGSRKRAGRAPYTEFLNYKPTYGKDALVSTGYIYVRCLYRWNRGWYDQSNQCITRALAKISFTVNTDNFRLADMERCLLSWSMASVCIMCRWK